MAKGMIGERWRWVVVAFLLGCLLIGLVREAVADTSTAEESAPQQTPILADGPALSTDRSLTGIDALSGTFEQTIRDPKGELVATSQGEFAILKPHFLRWFVRAPGQQLLVSDGEYLWQHDLDLETLVRQPIDRGQNSPLRLLIEPEASLTSDYSISRDAQTIRLTPLTDSSLFQVVTLFFDGEHIRAMQLLDNLGQTIDVVLSLNPETMLTPGDFQFEVPEGMDITIREP